MHNLNSALRALDMQLNILIQDLATSIYTKHETAITT